MKNNRGFSLIEIMIAIGLLGGLSVWMMQIFSQQTKNEKTTATNMDIDAIGNEIRNILGDGDSCEKNFKGMTPTKAAAISDLIKVLSDGTAQKRFSVGDKKTGNTGVVISSFDLLPDEKYFIPAGKKIGDTVLNIIFDRGKMIQGAKTKSFKIPLSVVLDDSGNIAGCHALASTINLASICNALGRSVSEEKQKCNPPAVYEKGDIPIFMKQYIHCQGGAGGGELTLNEWTSPGTGTARISWSAAANDTTVTFNVYRNQSLLSSTTSSGMTFENLSKDIDIKKGDVIKHTAILSGGIDNDCLIDGTFSVGLDLLNMM